MGTWWRSYFSIFSIFWYGNNMFRRKFSFPLLDYFPIFPLTPAAGHSQFSHNAAAALFCLLHFLFGYKNSLFWPDYSSWWCKGLISCFPFHASLISLVDDISIYAYFFTVSSNRQGICSSSHKIFRELQALLSQSFC